MKALKKIFKYFILWNIGGVTYVLIELAYRSYSHISMYFLAFILFIVLGLLNECFSWETPFWKQCVLGAIIVTILELITGYIVNIWLGWNVWNYSNLPCSFFDGQINLFFSIAWFFLSGVAIVLDDWLRYWLFKEEKPRYKFI